MAKSFQDLTIRDAFMFAAVMADEDQCRRFLTVALEMNVLEVKVVAEKTMSYHPEHHGVRLDVLAEEDGSKRRFNVEMQIRSLKGLPQRTRYYHSQMDMDALRTGMKYDALSDTYVIFVCDFDPCGDHLYKYFFENICRETGKPLMDGHYTILLSTRGENDSEVPEDLVNFLKYVRDPEAPAPKEDEFVSDIERQIDAIKRNRDWEAKFVLLEEMMEEERAQGEAKGMARGKAEYILAIIKTHGDIPDDIRERILNEKDLKLLDQWFSLALSVKNVDEFLSKMDA